MHPDQFNKMLEQNMQRFKFFTQRTESSSICCLYPTLIKLSTVISLYYKSIPKKLMRKKSFKSKDILFKSWASWKSLIHTLATLLNSIHYLKTNKTKNNAFLELLSQVWSWEVYFRKGSSEKYIKLSNWIGMGCHTWESKDAVLDLNTHKRSPNNKTNWA